MTGTSTKNQKKNWLKLGIIPVLVGVLGYVVWSNRSPGSAEPTEVATLPPELATQTAKAPVKSEASPAPDAKKKRVAWPKFTTEQILATNPFRGSLAMRNALKPAEEPVASTSPGDAASKPGDEHPEEEHDPWALLAESFKGDSSAVFLESSKGSVLRVGSKTLKVGDLIGNRYRVTEVRPDGVVVEAAPALK